MTAQVFNGLPFQHFRPNGREQVTYSWRSVVPVSLVSLLTQIVILPHAFAQEATFQLADSSRSGELVELTEERATLRSGSNTETLAVDSLEVISFSGKPAELEAAASVILNDGSVIRANSLQTSGLLLAIKIDSAAVGIPLRAIRAVQLGSLSDAESADWQKILKAEIAADVLAIRRPSGRLEKIEGIILEVRSESLKFDFSGSQIDVPLDKLAGYRTFSAESEASAAPSIVLRDRFGGTWNCTSATKDKGNARFQIVTASNAKIELPANAIAKLNFSLGRSLALTKRDDSRLAVQFSSAQPGLNWLESSIGSSELLNPFITTYTKPDSTTQWPAIEIPSGGNVSFRIPEGYKRLETKALMKRTGSLLSPMHMQIMLNKKVILEFDLNDKEFSRDIAVDVSAEELLEIQVRSKAKLPIGTATLLLDPKLSK